MVRMCKTMDVLDDEKASEDTQPKTNNPPSSKHNPIDTTTLDTHRSTINQSPFNTDDDIPSSYPKLFDWDQRGPPIFDRFENDDALTKRL